MKKIIEIRMIEEVKEKKFLKNGKNGIYGNFRKRSFDVIWINGI